MSMAGARSKENRVPIQTTEHQQWHPQIEKSNALAIRNGPKVTNYIIATTLNPMNEALQ